MNLDPELAEFAALLPEPAFADVAAARERASIWAQMNKPDVPENLVVEDRAIHGPGDNELRLRIYKPAPRADAVPGILHFHGGGFMVGDLDLEHRENLSLASELGIVIVSVDYRLAPEDPFPAVFDDCYHSLAWVAENATVLGVDVDRIGVFGQSAGGGLAAAVALAARDRNGPNLCAQILSIPVVDDRLDTPSMRQFVDSPLWTSGLAAVSWEAYVGTDRSDLSPYAAPARASDVRRLPPAYIATAENDPLRDEGILYALKLLEAGVSVELHQYPGTFHGSTMLPSAISERQIRDLTEAINLGLRR